MTAIHSSRTKRSEIFSDADAGTMRELLRLSRFIEILASEHDEHSNGHRSKRDTSHYLNDVVHEIQTELENLETTMDLDASASAENTNTSSTQKFGIKCFIETSGKVNCSSVIYENEKSWKKSRDQVDLLIQVLKTKIVELKDIRRHLKDHKPKNVTDEDEANEEDDENGLSSTEDSDETSEKMANVQKQSRRPHYNNDTNHTSKRPHRVHSTTSAMSTAWSSSSSTTTITTTSMTSTTSKPRTTTTRAKSTSTATSANTTHPIAARKTHPSSRNATAPIKTPNSENTHRHHHQQHAKVSGFNHTTKRKILGDSTQIPISVGPKTDRREKIDEKFDQGVDQSRTACLCEPDTER